MFFVIHLLCYVYNYFNWNKACYYVIVEFWFCNQCLSMHNAYCMHWLDVFVTQLLQLFIYEDSFLGGIKKLAVCNLLIFVRWFVKSVNKATSFGFWRSSICQLWVCRLL